MDNSYILKSCTIFKSVRDKSFSELSVAAESRGGWCRWDSVPFLERYQWLSWYRKTITFIGHVLSEEAALWATVCWPWSLRLDLTLTFSIILFLRSFFWSYNPSPSHLFKYIVKTWILWVSIGNKINNENYYT